MTPLLLVLTIAIVFLLAAVIIVAINVHKKITAAEERMKAIEEKNLILHNAMIVLTKECLITTLQCGELYSAYKAFSPQPTTTKNKVFH